ncbi:hypothetical protein [Streptomyces ochraceiscleroticus]|uniref:Uncharacterized protein n=1 Tax=Streptomyces ochraceiscleroticus TaxID=47761 RepID=A0ABW1MW77_9ACTN|nr:hypothetical protein [Streptomyces ochraceiscleroticus]
MTVTQEAPGTVEDSGPPRAGWQLPPLEAEDDFDAEPHIIRGTD